MSLERLINIGFIKIGEWKFDSKNSELNLSVENNIETQNTGLQLASIGYKTKKKDVKWPMPSDPNSPSEIQIISDYWFIEMPVAGRFELNQKKSFSFY